MILRFRFIFASFLLVVALSIFAHGGRNVSNAILYVGNNIDSHVVAIDTVTNEIVNPSFAVPPLGSVETGGPRGLFFKGEYLTIVMQNVFTPGGGESPVNGTILQFQKSTGQFVRALVSETNADASWAPRGAVWIPGNILVVADGGGDPGDIENHPSRIRLYSYATGQQIRSFGIPASAASIVPVFTARAVIYYRGKLYVTHNDNALQKVGYVSRFDPVAGFEAVLTTHPRLHRPDGLAIGPDGNLWVTSFLNRENATEVDRIMVFTIQGELVKEIPLYTPGEDRYFTQAIVFGPDQNLYMGGPALGQVRKYSLATGQFSVVCEGIAGWYLAFLKTDPSSLEYRND
jgi:hypothetical protein